MSKVSLRELFEAGAHFGHRTRFWNPKMAPYIYGKRGDIHIINLEKTVPMLNDALNFVGTVVANGGSVMFVGTKRSASEAVGEAAARCGMPYVNFRWLGGMMTNFKTIRQSINRLEAIERMAEDGTFQKLVKKEVIVLGRERDKLARSLTGIRHMRRLPDVLFVIDVGHEHIASITLFRATTTLSARFASMWTRSPAQLRKPRLLSPPVAARTPRRHWRKRSWLMNRLLKLPKAATPSNLSVFA